MGTARALHIEARCRLLPLLSALTVTGHIKSSDGFALLSGLVYNRLQERELCTSAVVQALDFVWFDVSLGV